MFPRKAPYWLRILWKGESNESPLSRLTGSAEIITTHDIAPVNSVKKFEGKISAFSELWGIRRYKEKGEIHESIYDQIKYFEDKRAREKQARQTARVRARNPPVKRERKAPRTEQTKNPPGKDLNKPRSKKSVKSEQRPRGRPTKTKDKRTAEINKEIDKRIKHARKQVIDIIQTAPTPSINSNQDQPPFISMTCNNGYHALCNPKSKSKYQRRCKCHCHMAAKEGKPKPLFSSPAPQETPGKEPQGLNQWL